MRAAILAGSPAPAQYVLPHCNDMKEMGSEVMIQKYTEGPVAVLTIILETAVDRLRCLKERV